jgi:nitroimidazol reductase NimA-like FMN-containing flavoprotein (pyridoxamine 5'-phosphate oxidase superfamily)
LGASEARPPSWRETRARLEEAQFYWLSTARPDGRPHIMPVLAVWLEGSLHFSASPGSRKSRNLAHGHHCAVAVDSDDLHLVVEGTASKVANGARLERLAGLYATKYGWDVTVHDGTFYGDGAPSAGLPPFDVFEIRPAAVFAFGTDESFGAIRWRFENGTE